MVRIRVRDKQGNVHTSKHLMFSNWWKRGTDNKLQENAITQPVNTERIHSTKTVIGKVGHTSVRTWEVMILGLHVHMYLRKSDAVFSLINFLSPKFWWFSILKFHKNQAIRTYLNCIKLCCIFYSTQCMIWAVGGFLHSGFYKKKFRPEDLQVSKCNIWGLINSRELRRWTNTEERMRNFHST